VTAAAPSELDDDRATQRRRQILHVARGVFAELGYHRASINEIIKRADIARGTFYLYFESKQTVFDSILDEAMQELRARITRVDIDTPGAPPPQVQLRENLVRIIDYVLGERTLSVILLSPGQVPDAEASARVVAFFTELRALIALSLEHGIGMKLVRPCDTHLVAAMLLGAVRGAIEHGLEAGNRSPRADALVDELLLFAMRSVLIP
jgi:AcrR family transcriptional regulator